MLKPSFAVLFIFITQLFAQGSNYSLEHISVQDGLSQSSVYCIYQDSKGFLWFGTADGLNRYDGYEIKVFRHNIDDKFSISDNTVRQINEDNDGNLWIITDKGLNELSAQTYKMRNSYNDSSRIFTDIPERDIREYVIVDNKNNIWLASINSVHVYNPENNFHNEFKLTYEYNDLITYLYMDKNNGIWAAAAHKRLFYYEKEKNKFTELALPVDIIKDKKIISLFSDSNYLYVILNSSELLKISLTNKSIQEINLTLTGQLEEKPLILLKNAAHWEGSTYIALVENMGVYFLNIQTGELDKIKLNIKEPTGINLHSFYNIYQDDSGIFWIGTDDGINKLNLNPKKFKHYLLKSSNDEDSRGNYVKSILKDKNGNVWVGTFEFGLNKMDLNSGTIKTFRANDGLGTKDYNSIFSSLEDSGGHLWFGGVNFLYKKDDNFDKFKSYKIEGTIYSMAEYPKGTLWLATSDGIYKTNTKDIESNLKKLYWATCWCIFHGPNDDIYCGTNGVGLVIINAKTNSVQSLMNKAGDSNSLSNNVVRTICRDAIDKNILWIGTNEGLNKLDLTNNKFTQYFTNNEFLDDYIYGLLSDNNGNLWISTNRGITRFDPAKNNFRNYSLFDGLQSYEFNTGAYFKDNDGNFYFGGINGFNVFNPDSIFDNQYIPKIALTKFNIFDKPYEKTNTTELKEINLGFNQNTISFEYAGLEYTNPAQNKYSIKLKGFDKNWTSMGTKRQARYTNLNPGKYVLMIKASNNDGVWNPVPLEIAINIIPPFWMTLWFKILMFIAVIITSIGIIRYIELRKYRARLAVLEQNEALNRERIRISNDMHDDVGSVLTKISLLTASLNNRSNLSSEIKNITNKISNSNNEAVEKLDEIVWALNPKNDNLKNLSEYLSEYAEDYFEDTNIKCRFDFPQDISLTPLNSDIRHNIFLVFKEALNNIAKYSHADKVVIIFTETNENFSITIHDNGIGFNSKGIEGQGNGLKNMRQRIEKIGGYFDIESIQDVGTKVTFKISFK
jgi:signal transduction histidine kinase/ligand-binding sensor domain-containing protein